MRKVLIPLLLALAAALAWLLFSPTDEQEHNLDQLEFSTLNNNQDVAESNSDAGSRINSVELPSFNNRQEKVGLGKHKMSGIVVDENNQAVSGCWVAAYSVPFPLFDFTSDITEIFEKPLDFNLEPMASVFADHEGRFNLRGLQGRTIYLTARTKQRLTPRRQRVLSENLNNSDSPVIVRTVAAASVSGKVVDANGSAVAGAEVLIGPGVKYLLSAFRNRSFFMERIYSDASGTFEIEAVPAGIPLTVNAWRGGVEGGMREFGPLAPSTENNIQVKLFQLGTLEGEILDTEDKAITGADVIALPLDLRLTIPFVRDPMLWTATSNSKGQYRFTQLPNASYLLMAQGQQGRSAPGSAQVNGNGSLAGPLVINTSQTVSGRIVDSVGKPVVRAMVKLMAIPTSTEDRGSERSRMNRPGGILMEAAQEILPELIPETTFTTTNAKGEFKIPAWKQAKLRVEAKGYAHFDFSLNNLKDEHQPVLQISKPGGIRGKVINSIDDQAVSICLIRGEMARDSQAMTAQIQSLGYISDGVEANSKPEPEVSWLNDGEQLIRSTNSWRQKAQASYFVDNDQGSFEITGLPPGAWYLTTQAEGFTSSKSPAVIVAENKITKDVVLSLEPGASVSGRVVEAGTSNPIAGAVVTAGKGEESGFMAMLQGMGDSVAMAETDSDGFFTVHGVESGADHVNVLADGYAAASSKVEALEQHEQRTGIKVEVPFGGTLTGTVYDRNNNPLPGRMVGAASMQAKDFQQTAANGDGVYTMSNMKAGSYIMVTAALDDESLFTGDIMTMLSGSKITTANVRENEVTQLDIIDSSAGGCRVEGEVLDRGIPVPNANILMLKANSGMLDFGMSTARSNKDGKFVFKSLEPGEYRAQIDTGDWNGALEVEVMDAAEDFLLLEIPVSNVRGRLIAEGSGMPVPDLSLTLRGMNQNQGMMSMMFGGGRNGSRAGWCQSNDDGFFEFERISAGRYQVVVKGGKVDGVGSFSEVTSKTFTLREGDDFDLGDIKLPLGGIIDIQVSFSGDTKQTWFSTSAWPSEKTKEDNDSKSKQSWGRVTDEGASSLLEGLEPGLWDVEVKADGYASATLTKVAVSAGETTVCKINLEQGGKVRVSILENGDLVNADKVVLINSNGDHVASDGRGNVPLALRGIIPAGNVHLASHAPGVYKIIAQKGGVERETQVDVRSGQTSSIDINF